MINASRKTALIIRRLLLSTAAIACLFITPASANGIGDIELPDMGESATRGFSHNEQSAYGHRAWLTLKNRGIVLDDPEVSAYLQALGERIATGTGLPLGSFKFFPVASNVVNAFAMPGGYIGMHTGLMTAAESEHELAGVMGHEIIHVTQQHIARLLEKERPWSAATTALVIAALLLGGGDPDITQAAIGTGLASGLERRVNYTRAHEHEADRLAVPLLAQAGIDPTGMAAFFNRLYKLRANYDNTFAGILQTHPLTATRIAEAKERAAAYPVTNPKTSGLFEIIRERARVLTTPSRESPEAFYPKQLVSAKSNPGILYGQALSASLNGNHERAIAGFKALLEADSSNLLFHLAYARALQRGNQQQQASAQWQRSEALFADNSLFLYRYGEALLQLKQPKLAKDALLSIYEKRPKNPEINDLLARASADQNQLVDAHIYKANYWLYNGDGDHAGRQLKAAIASTEFNDAERDRLKQKLEEVRRLEKAAKEGRG
jgi:predicted Zn-dependent protease